MGSKGQSQTNQVQSYTPAPQAVAATQGALTQAQNAAQLPFSVPQAPVAGFSPDQLAAFQTVNNSQGMANPYFTQASQLFNQSAQPPDISQFFNPLAGAVGANMQNLFGQQNVQNTGSLTQAAGGVGADRIAIGQGNLANQQALAYGQTMAGLYQPSLSAAQQEQSILQGAGYGIGALGPAAQNSVLQGAQAQLGTGGLQQQLSQAQLNAPYQLQLAQAMFPYQQSNFLTNAVGSLAPGFGGTTSGYGNSTPAPPSLFSQIAGLGAVGAGVYGGLGGFGGTSTPSLYSGSQIPGAVGPTSVNGGQLLSATGGAVHPFEGFDQGGAPSPFGATPDTPINIDTQPIVPQGQTAKIAPHIPQVNLNPPQQSQSGPSASDFANIAKTALQIGTMFAARGGGISSDQMKTFDGHDPYSFFESRFPKGYAQGGSPFFDDGGDTSGAQDNTSSWMGFAQSPREQGGLGLAPHQAAGLVGNLMQESGPGLNPWGPTGDNGTAMGTAQWRKERLQGLKDFSQQNGMDYRTTQAQQAYMRHEFDTTEQGSYAALQQAQTPEEAADIVNRKYERSADRSGKRAAYARQLSQPQSQALGYAADAPAGGGLTPGDPNQPFDPKAFAAQAGKLAARANEPSVPLSQVDPNEFKANADALAAKGTTPSTPYPNTPYVNDDIFKATADAEAAGQPPSPVPMPQSRPDAAPQANVGQRELPPNATPTSGQGSPFASERQKTMADNPWLPLIAAGFGMMGGTSPYAGVNIGQGGMQGVKALMEQKQQAQKDETIDQASRRLDQEAQFHQDEFTKAKPYEQFQMNKPQPMGQTIGPLGLPMTTYGVRDQNGQWTPVQGNAAQEGGIDNPVTNIAQAIENGHRPPNLTNLGRLAPLISAKLEKDGFDQSRALLEYDAAHKQILSLNGPQMVRFVGLAGSVDRTIDEVKDLSTQMKNSGVPVLNAIKMQAYIQSEGNSEKGQLAARYIGAVNTLKEEFANLANGGYAPTEPAWKLANEQINGNYGVDELGASLNEVQRLIRYRMQGIPNMQSLGPGATNRYVPGVQGAPQQPAGAPAPPISGGDPLAEARAAIAKGAPRDAVIKRLQEHGIDATGL